MNSSDLIQWRRLQRAYYGLTYGNCFPSIEASVGALRWMKEVTSPSLLLVPFHFGQTPVTENPLLPDYVVRFTVSVPAGSLHPVTGEPYNIEPEEVRLEI